MRFWATFGGLGTTYDVHRGLIGKCVMDFLLVLTKRFSLDVTAETVQANIGSKSAISLQRWPVDPTFNVEGVTPHQPFFFLKKTKLNGRSYGIKIWTDLSSVLSESTRLTDGQTYNFLMTRPPCIHCSAVKTQHIMSGNENTETLKSVTTRSVVSLFYSQRNFYMQTFNTQQK